MNADKIGYKLFLKICVHQRLSVDKKYFLAVFVVKNKTRLLSQA
jgi:hypothetical protein